MPKSHGEGVSGRMWKNEGMMNVRCACGPVATGCSKSRDSPVGDVSVGVLGVVCWWQVASAQALKRMGAKETGFPSRSLEQARFAPAIWRAGGHAVN